MSNYPEGVTGRELQIAGPDWEGTVGYCCRNWSCNFEGDMEAWMYGHTLTIECPECGEEFTEQEGEE
jgi:hypothetical protein